MSRHARFLFTSLLAVLLCSSAALANPISTLNIAKGGWRTTVDASVGAPWLTGASPSGQGRTARGNYTNPQTHTLAWYDMTWYCTKAPNDCHDQADLDPIAYFATDFTLSSAHESGLVRMIADDYMELWVNGHFIFDALLVDNLKSGQPNPLEVLITGQNISLWSGKALYESPFIFDDVLNVGTSVIAIKAMDGTYDPTCAAAGTVSIPGKDGAASGTCFSPSIFGNRYLYVHTPEPATLVLFGFAALLLLRRRKAR